MSSINESEKGTNANVNVDDTGNGSKNQSSGGWFKPLRLQRNQYMFVIGLFTLIGVVGGYAYYSLVGCKTGGCTITSSPVMSIIWGGMVGYLVPDMFIKQKN